jgi:hypothetical protein
MVAQGANHVMRQARFAFNFGDSCLPQPCMRIPDVIRGRASISSQGES